jgi:two-component system chemotaxis response regulator CheB
VSSLVLIGASWGGMAAVGELLSPLRDVDLPPVVVIQHRREGTGALLTVWAQATGRPVVEPDDRDPILPGHIHVAPPDYHLIVGAEGFRLSIDPPVAFARPSIDVAFESAAEVFGRRAVGVIVTGTNVDGADGLAAICRAGGKGFVQDPATAQAAEMPRAAAAACPGAQVLPLAGIAAQLRRLYSLTERLR